MFKPTTLLLAIPLTLGIAGIAAAETTRGPSPPSAVSGPDNKPVAKDVDCSKPANVGLSGCGPKVVQSGKSAALTEPRARMDAQRPNEGTIVSDKVGGSR